MQRRWLFLIWPAAQSAPAQLELDGIVPALERNLVRGEAHLGIEKIARQLIPAVALLPIAQGPREAIVHLPFDTPQPHTHAALSAPPQRLIQLRHGLPHAGQTRVGHQLVPAVPAAALAQRDLQRQVIEPERRHLDDRAVTGRVDVVAVVGPRGPRQAGHSNSWVPVMMSYSDRPYL